MDDQSSRFLDRVQEESGIRERGRALSGVRAVFYALFRPLGNDRAGGLAETLPPELESLWKPAYFQCLRDGLNGGGDEEGVHVALRRVQRLTPTVTGDEAGELLDAVIGVLRTELDGDDWGEISSRLPDGLNGASDDGDPRSG